MHTCVCNTVHVCLGLSTWKYFILHVLHQMDGTDPNRCFTTNNVDFRFSFSACVCVYSDLLFNQLYSRLVENMVAKAVFLESLESYVVADRVGHLTPAIMRDLLDHYHSNGMMDSLERCIVHLDVTSLDIQQVCMHV